MKKYGEVLDPTIVGGVLLLSTYLGIDLYDRYKKYKDNKKKNSDFKGSVTQERGLEVLNSIKSNIKKYDTFVSSRVKNMKFVDPDMKKGFKTDIDYYIFENKIYITTIGYDISLMRPNDYKTLWNEGTASQRLFVANFNKSYADAKEITYDFLDMIQKEFPDMYFRYDGSDGDHKGGRLVIVSETISGPKLHAEVIAFREAIRGLYY